MPEVDGQGAIVIVTALDYMTSGPRPLHHSLEFAAGADYHLPKLTVDQALAHIQRTGPNDPASVSFQQHLVGWDYQADASWTGGTSRNTLARRERIYELLGITPALRPEFSRLFPIYPALDPPTVIEDAARPEWKPWYTGDRRIASHFYWSAYSKHLATVGRWGARNLAALDASTSDIVQRLADPTAAAVYQAKGLAVGYVQSGKTVNFTGVIAKAVDAGYRLVIVLAGTLDILREQTQRRLDKELVGRELLGDEYANDSELPFFLSHGGLPSDFGAVDWERLTLARQDFQQMLVGLSALEFQKADPTKPFYNPANLLRARARLLVVKKNARVLGKVLKALERVGARCSLNEVPALIVDDESDQASVNTARRQTAEERKKRSAINQKIVSLLTLLPRGQYVGYTATPFANVFIDPEDATDLFPSSFIVSLPRPEGYMGINDFYDQDEVEDGDFRSNRQSFVRFVSEEDLKESNLPTAIDAYILAGAIKLWREANHGKPYRHHTMLVHHSAFTTVHEDQAQLVKRLFDRANYTGGGPGAARLERLWQDDHVKVWAAQGGEEGMPKRYSQLLRHVAACCARVTAGGKPVLIVNGDNNDDAPNFEQSPVWKIIVGGTKLSRGYTIEGLTVSYYRRRAGAADTLMQMGRWFGFRQGYRDLVRLYIGNREPLDRKGRRFVDLYEAFRGICIDEDEFRSELERYSSLESGQRVTPKQIPPLVPSTVLRPTAANKMFNARLEFENFGGRFVERTVATSDEAEKKENRQLTEDLLKGSGLARQQLDVVVAPWERKPQREVSFPAYIGVVSAQSMLEYLWTFKWSEGQRPLARVCEFLEGKHGDPEIERWLIVAPQPKGAQATSWWHCGPALAVRERSRTGGLTGRYGVFSESLHVAAAEYLNCLREGTKPSTAALAWRYGRQAVMLFYPVLSKEEGASRLTPTMGFALLFPRNTLRTRIKYTVIDPSHEDAVVVDV